MGKIARAGPATRALTDQILPRPRLTTYEGEKQIARSALVFRRRQVEAFSK